MSYKLIQPPTKSFDNHDFAESTRAELLAYREWFLLAIPERVNMLHHEIVSTQGFEEWRPDESIGSLQDVGEWLFQEAATRLMTEEEIQASIAMFRSHPKFPVQHWDDVRFLQEGLVKPETLTDRTVSLAWDIGMYFAQVVLANLPGTQWSQRLRGQSMVEYGHVFITGFKGFKGGELNPVRVVMNVARKYARKAAPPSELRATFEVWAAHNR